MSPPGPPRQPIVSSADSDPFLLITREPSSFGALNPSENVLSPVSSRFSYPLIPPLTLSDHLRSCSRAWPLSFLSLIDLGITNYFLYTYLVNSPLTEGSRQQLIYVVIVAYLRGTTLLLSSLSKYWRTKAAWLVFVGVATGCVVVWVVNWLVQAKSSDEGESKMWWRCLEAQVVLAFIDYATFNILLNISPLSPYPHIRTKPNLTSLAHARRRQRATSVRYREETIHSDIDSPSGVYGSMDDTSHLERYPDAQLLGRSPDIDEDVESIGRFSDEGDGSDSDSDLSISSNEIVDIPPPRSPALSATANRLVGSGSQNGLRARFGSGWSLNRVATGEGERLEHVNESAFRRRSLQFPNEEDARPVEVDEHEYPHPGEDRLERSLRKKWAQRARSLFGRGKGTTGSTGGEGMHVVTEGEEAEDGRYGTFAT